MSIRYKGESERDFIKQFSTFLGAHSAWQVWADMVYMFAATLSNTVDTRYRDAREAAYMSIIGRYKPDEQKRFPELFGMLVLALEDNPGRDFLGDIFMQLELSNHWHGQFFTPESICTMIAKMNLHGLQERIEKQGWVSVCDPACGAGAMLLAVAEEAKTLGINYHNQLLFACQDIDQTAALMCYIQLSLLGCPGYVKVGNTLTDPMVGDVLFPGDGENIWITPFFCSEVWHYRRQFRMIDSLIGRTKLPPQEETDEDIPSNVPMPSLAPELPLEESPHLSPMIIEINKKRGRRQSSGQLMFDIEHGVEEDKCS